MKLPRPSALLFLSIILTGPLALAGPHRGAVSRPAVSRPSVSRSVGGFHGVSRSSVGSLRSQNWSTNHFARPNFAPSNFSASNLHRANFSRTNFAGANLHTYNNSHRGTIASSSTSLRNNSIVRSNNLSGQRSLNRIRDGRFVSNNHRNGNGNWNGSWNQHHHHHGGSTIIFVGGFGYPYYFPSYYDGYPYSYYPSGYGDSYGYDTYPAASYGYSGGTYDGGVYQGGNADVYQDGSNYQDDQSGGDYGAASDSSVAEVQRVLSREGFYHGQIDGMAGSRTFYAIRAYERSHNLRADGQITQELLNAMGLH
jgi:hypothetical protein